MTPTQSTPEDVRAAGIAIVGMAGRFPGASTVAEFWNNLAAGVESIKFATDEELAAAGVNAGLIANPSYVRASSTIPEPEFFDAQFFGFSARDAEIIDPQQRVFLECAWEALEDAGCDPDAFAGAIGVFAGSGINTYAVLNLFSRPDLVQSAGAYQIMVGNDKDFLSTRAAYKLNLRGPAIGVQTACSTSLVAVQMAFESLLRGECDMALAGGVSIPVPQSPGYLYVPGMILSRDGHCRAFDAAASGTVPGSGAGVVVLKRLNEALADSDHIYAVLHGAAINNDGSGKIGYSAPSVEGQTAVIQRSMEMAGFLPESVSYVEAHGTGTEVGDPIEFASLARAFASAVAGSASCALGSVKTNIGHLDTASGVAGLIKAALALKHRAIPPTLHFTKANPLIDFAATPFHVNTRLLPFSKAEPFRAGVSSFGIGGTNAHVSLAEPPLLSSDQSGGSELIVLSAKSATALDARLSQLEVFLDAHPTSSLADLAFTLQVGRKPFEHRQAIVAESVAELNTMLKSRSSASSKVRSLRCDRTPNSPPRVAFLFPGQGSQYVNMGRDLYRTERIFQETVDQCCELLTSHLHLDLRSILYPEAGAESDAAELLARTSITQPVLFVIEYAMAKLWMSCGILPSAMLGHSIGEYVAACIAGVFSLDDALAIVAERGRLIQSLDPGVMLAVGLSEDDLTSLLPGGASIAAINSSAQTVASGDAAAIALLEAALHKRKIECRRLRTSHAFHSPMMEPILDSFVQYVALRRRNAPSLRYLSNVTGAWITEKQATDPAYWGSHLRSTVRFADCAQAVRAEAEALLEVGPGDTLLSLMRGRSEPPDDTMIPSMRHRLAGEDDREHWLTAAGRLWLLNAPLDWKALHAGKRRLKLSLPTYPFQRRRYYIEPGEPVPAPHTALQKQTDIADWFYVPSWKRSIATSPSNGSANNSSCWLILAEDGPLKDALVAGLNSGEIVQARTGSHFNRIADLVYELDPANGEDFRRLVREIVSRGLWPGRVVHALLSTPASDASVQREMDRGPYSALALVQAIEETGMAKPVELNVVCDRAYSILGEAISSAAGEALNAFCNVVPVECANITVKVIDVDQSSGTLHMERLLRELHSPAQNETVALRGTARWLRIFEPTHLLPVTREDGKSVPLRAGGTYIITGGTGGIGLVLAKHIAKRAKARLVLTARTGFPPPSDWESLLEKPDIPADLKQKIEGLQAIWKNGGEVILVEADTADTSAMLEMVASLKEQYGKVDGIIHAAGIAGAGMVITKTREDMLATLSAKVQGTEWIRECLSRSDLDFAMLCSSISAVVPAFGLSAYAAANAYLDGFAAAHDDPDGTRVLSVGWDTWRDVGMAANAIVPPGLEARREEDLQHGIVSHEAEDIFDRVLATPMPQILISTRSFAPLMKLVEQGVADLRASAFDTLNAQSNAHPAEEFAATDDELERFVLDTWQELLGTQAIGLHDNFFQLGGHSLLGTQVLARIHSKFGVSLPLRTVFEASTPAALAQSVRLASWASIASTDHEETEREEIEL